MNPNLKNFLSKYSIALAGITLFMALAIWGKWFTGPFFEKAEEIGNYILLVAAFLVGITCVAYLFFKLFSHIWTNGIMNRAENILEIAVDEEFSFLYIVANSYESGNESGPGYYTYHHYLFELKNGEAIIFNSSQSKQQEKKALEYFHKKKNADIRLIKRERGKEIHQYQAGNYTIRCTKFKNSFDFGIKIRCSTPDKNIVWEKEI